MGICRWSDRLELIPPRIDGHRFLTGLIRCPGAIAILSDGRFGFTPSGVGSAEINTIMLRLLPDIRQNLLRFAGIGHTALVSKGMNRLIKVGDRLQVASHRLVNDAPLIQHHRSHRRMGKGIGIVGDRPFIVLQLLACGSSVKEGNGGVRSCLNGQAKVGDRPILVAAFRMKIPPVAVHGKLVRIQGNGLVQVFQGSCQILLLVADDAAQVINCRVVGHNCQNFVEIGDRPTLITQVIAGHCPVPVGINITGSGGSLIKAPNQLLNHLLFCRSQLQVCVAQKCLGLQPGIQPQNRKGII